MTKRYRTSGLASFISLWFIALALFSSVAQAAGELERYVYQADPAYSFSETSTVNGLGSKTYILRMNSQRWLTGSEVQPTLWQHQLSIIVPATLRTNRAHLYLHGGGLSSAVDTKLVSNLASIAIATGAITVVLEQVPAQPLKFSDEPKALTEDALVAYSWEKVMATGDATWAAYLPMTKASVRAMDTAQAYAKAELGLSISDFIVTGFSKRGAIAWLTAAIDPRVSAVAPGVFNVLKMDQQLKRHFNAYGQYSFAVHDYVERKLMRRLDTARGAFLRSIVDPISYRRTLTMPHYLLIAAGDEFFLPDASELFIHDLPGEVLQRIVPNANHSMQGAEVTALSGLLAWYQAILDNTPRPNLSWWLDARGALVATSDRTPASVRLWQATNSLERDFRVVTVGNAWHARRIYADSQGKYRASLNAPGAGYTASMLEFTYPDVGGVRPVYTTSVFVTPDTFPYKEVSLPLGAILLLLLN
jgi:PhoPQ-activated pathogenicity-related protein